MQLLSFHGVWCGISIIAVKWLPSSNVWRNRGCLCDKRDTRALLLRYFHWYLYFYLLTFTHFYPSFTHLLLTFTHQKPDLRKYLHTLTFFTHTLPDILIIICTSKIAERIAIVQIILTKYHKKLRVNYTIFCVDKYCNNDTNRWLSIAYIRAGEIPFTVKTLCKAYVNYCESYRL